MWKIQTFMRVDSAECENLSPDDQCIQPDPPIIQDCWQQSHLDYTFVAWPSSPHYTNKEIEICPYQ